MRMRLLTLLGLLALALGNVSCSTPGIETATTVTESVVIDHPQYPCGPYWWAEQTYHERFLQWTPDGTHIVFLYGTNLFVVDTEGTKVLTLFDANPGHKQFFPYGFYFDVSQDGKKIVYATCEFPTTGAEGGEDTSKTDRSKYNYELATIYLDGKEQRRLTENVYVDHFPVWSPDGSRIAFISNPSSDRFYARESDMALYTMAPDGSDVQLVAPSPQDGLALAPLVWSPDGESLAFQVHEGESWPLQRALYTVSLGGTGLTRLLGGVVSAASWSPDGQRLAVARVVGEEVALFTLAADGSDEQLITTITAREVFESWKSRYKAQMHTVSWSPDGAQILYTCDAGVCVVNLEDGRTIELVQDATLWEDDPYIAAWSPDGSRIAIYTPGYDIAPQLFTVARDRTNKSVLVEGSHNRIIAVNSAWRDVTKDIAACTEGFIVPNPAENEGLVQDCKTLLAIRDRLAGEVILNWSAEVPITEWEGIWVEGTPLRVRGLAFGLSMPTATGILPPEIGNLTYLKHLNFYHHRLTGSIPPELGKLTHLVILQLTGNRLEGSIPPEIGELKNLEVLQVSDNRLEGSIPAELGKLKSLEILSLEKNRLRSTLPSELGGLLQLRRLSLRNQEFERNVFTGCAPAELTDVWVEESGLKRCQ